MRQSFDWNYAVLAAQLRCGETLHIVSAAFLALTLGVWPYALHHADKWALGAMTETTVVGFAQIYYALRVKLDAALFAALAQTPDFHSLDAAMARQNLTRRDAPTRDPSLRIAGARRLLMRQALTLVVQMASLCVCLSLCARAVGC